MKAIYALYSSASDAQCALNRLENIGLPRRDLVVLSGEPLEPHGEDHAGSTAWMWVLAVIGGAVGLTLATWLTAAGEQAWPLPTGNMRIVPTWTNAVIVFEMTMLGAIAVTVTALVISARLGRRRRLYDPAVTNGYVLVGVERPAAHLTDRIHRALSTDTTVRVRTV